MVEQSFRDSQEWKEAALVQIGKWEAGGLQGPHAEAKHTCRKAGRQNPHSQAGCWEGGNLDQSQANQRADII